MTSVQVPSSPGGAPHVRRREASDSTTSEDDLAVIRAVEINVDDGEPKEGTQSKKAQPSSLSSGKSNETAKSSAYSMTSLRSLLGVPPSGNATGGLASPASVQQNKGSLLGVPPSTTARTAPPGIGGASGASLRAPSLSVGEDGRQTLRSEIAPRRKKVVLEPGCSALDWAQLKGRLASQRAQRPGGLAMARITPSELKQHNKRDDAWSAFHGKVYDMTPYLKFHPGGQQELMRVAGRDGTRLFMLTHSWVNIDAMIDACCVGILISEP